jgi:hypothetical protein
MVNSKDKGNAFETMIVKKLNASVNRSSFKRIAGSGAIGTNMGEPLLTGDVSGRIKGFPRPFKIECKVGYGGDKQLTLKREWINKIKKEAEQTLSIPLLIGKFSGARKADGVQEFIVMDVDDFIYILNLVSDLSFECDKLYENRK